MAVLPFIDKVLKPRAKALLNRHPVLKWYVKALLKRSPQLATDPFRAYPVAYNHDEGWFETLHIERNGLIRLEGWTKGGAIKEANLPRCFVNQIEAPRVGKFRIQRPVVGRHLLSHRGPLNLFGGLVCWYVARDLGSTPTNIQLIYRDQIILDITQKFSSLSAPAYENLFGTSEVLHREHIYGYGPPSPLVNEEVASLARELPGPVLDFGCGAGALVKYLLEQGLEAHGLEVDSQMIREAILPEVKTHITLYDGTLPLPWPSSRFRSVIATEVIEHVNNYEEVLQEIARITSESCLITVPDMSSIPICYPHTVVPWHLLESTHVNFFTQQSLERTLLKHFVEVEIMKILPIVTNNAKWYTSIAALCHK